MLQACLVQSGVNVFFLCETAWASGMLCASSPVVCKMSVRISSSYRISKKLWDLLMWAQIYLCQVHVSCAWVRGSRACPVLSRLVTLAIVLCECMGLPVVGVQCGQEALLLFGVMWNMIQKYSAESSQNQSGSVLVRAGAGANQPDIS